MAGTSEQRLKKYREKRDFERTAEPSGTAEASPDGHRFVVQRHRARRRHYDLRLELDGVLVSWAVPKGPTLDSKARHLAMHVEDHPLEYVEFEGTIPEGEYGGGDVIVWDHGTWEPVQTDDPAGAIADGNLHFDLFGAKLAGRFVLVRKDNSGKEQWLLLHKQDEHAQPGWEPEQHPLSVKSGRTNEEVAADPEAIWRSDLPAAEAEVPVRPRRWAGPTDDEIAALDTLGGQGRWRLGEREIRLTNLDKVLFPARDDEEPVTKRELIRYHVLIAPVMLPYLAGRPLNSHRFPDGAGKNGFWHKQVPSHAPDWITTWRNADADRGEAERYIVADSAATLAWLANYGALELHAWTSRTENVEYPTWALFDIDPGPDTSFENVLTLARLHRTALDHLGVQARPKVTGQRGIQIWVPVRPKYTFAETRSWTEKVSRAIGHTMPDLISWKWEKNARGGLARLDYTQNARNKTLVAPYSARPRPGAPVSVPLEWDELDDPKLRPDRWTIRTVLDRVITVGDPFAPLLDLEQDLPPV